MGLLVGTGHILDTLMIISPSTQVEDVSYKVTEEADDSEEEDDPSFLPQKHRESDSDEDDDDDDDESESSEDSDEDSTALENGNNNDDLFDEESLELPSPKNEMTDIKHDEIVTDDVGYKRKLEADQSEDEGPKNKKSSDDVEAWKEKNLYSDLNNSLETGYTSDLHSDFEEDIASLPLPLI